MLAVLLIEMEWWKESRTPAAAVRQQYYKPIKIEDEVKLSGDGIFFKKCSYYQQGKISIIKNGIINSTSEVVENYA